MDKEQKSLYTNAEMASLAIRDALERNGNVTEQDIDFLATGTTRADLLLPGFASMVHAETGLPLWKLHLIPVYAPAECMHSRMRMYI